MIIYNYQAMFYTFLYLDIQTNMKDVQIIFDNLYKLNGRNLPYISLSFKEISQILKKNGHFLTINYRLGGRLKERYMPIKEGNYTY